MARPFTARAEATPRPRDPAFGRVGPVQVLDARLEAPSPDVHALAMRLGALCPALLESGDRAPSSVHVLPLSPRALLVKEESRVRWLTPDGESLAEPGGGALDAMGRCLARLRRGVAGGGDALGFGGGLVTLLGYDVAHEIERLPRVARARDAWPDALAWLVPAALLVPAGGAAPRLLALPDAGAGRGDLRVGLSAEERRALVANVEDAWASAQGSDAVPAVGPLPAGATAPAIALGTAEDHARMVRAIREHLFAGDIYQANVGLRFEAPWEGSALGLHAFLRGRDPSPYSGWLRWPGGEFVSNTPERLVRLEGRTLRTEPIAGTAPVPEGADPAQVAEIEARLRASAKDAAEHVMIVDHHRNDLGRVSAPGTVRAERVFRVDRRRHVLHAVADIRGRLAAGCSAMDVVRAMLPGGCVSGVPKVRCMEIIDAVEPWRRGPWTGAFGWLGAGGDLDLAVVIRSAWRTGGTLAFAAGGGIVLDSDEAAEHAELLAKAEALRAACDALRLPQRLAAASAGGLA